MTIQIQPLKGFRDFLPQEALKRDWLKQKITGVFEQWGYDPMETPTLEPLELFAGQIGEDEKLFFKFQDPGGRNVALRYDQTVPTCRVVGQYSQQLPMPFRRYQIQSAFRAENTQKGRYREFLQCDADIFGITGPIADAEVIALSLDIYRQLGFKEIKVLINDRVLFKEVPYEAVVAIDKLDKIGEEGVIADMVKKGISIDQAKAYLDTVRSVQPNETIAVILNYLKAAGFNEDFYAFEPTIARSFSYSTGPIWEVKVNGGGSSVLGGERYDALIEKIAGVTLPGTGFGLGFDRTLEAAEVAGLIPSALTKTQALVTIFSPNFLPQSLATAKQLREQGIRTEVFPDTETNLGKQFKYADKKGIPFVIVIGEEEAKQNKVQLKNMVSGQQELLTVEEVIERLKNN